MNIAIIPARMGSQRLKQKNLRTLGGVPLLIRAIRKCQAAACFDEIWVNSEHDTFAKLAAQEGVKFHKRPEPLASDTATSEQFIHEFLLQHECERVFQVHSIAPLLSSDQVRAFVAAMVQDDVDTLLSCTHEQIECALGGVPVNFSFTEKTNSQELRPIQRISWGITGWCRAAYLEAFAAGKTATYAGEIGFHVLDRLAGHIIKTEEDLQIAEALLPLHELNES